MLYACDTSNLKQIRLSDCGSHNGITGRGYIHVQEITIPHLVGNGTIFTFADKDLAEKNLLKTGAGRFQDVLHVEDEMVHHSLAVLSSAKFY